MAQSMHSSEYFFKVEGLHCVRCIRKVQAIGDNFESVHSLKVDLGDQVVTTRVSSNFSVEDFISQLGTNGFFVSSVIKNQSSSPLKFNKQNLMKIGVAGACAGNIMLLAAAEYAGATLPKWPYFFKGTGFLFFLPIFFYSALPLYKNTWLSLREGRGSIDTPIVLAIVGGALLSTYNLFFTSHGDVYFDSLSMFVFFLLASRYVVQNIQSHYSSRVSMEDIFIHPRSLLEQDVGLKPVDSSAVKVGQCVFIEKGQFIPFDGVVRSSKAMITDTFFSGEAYPKIIKNMGKVFSGSKNVGNGFSMRVEKSIDETRLSKIVKMLNASLNSKTPLTSLVDQGARGLTYFIIVVSTLILGYFAFFELNLEEGVNRALALLVVACPCGLAIATPLVQILSVKKALKNSLLVKDVSVFEVLQQIDAVFFDKTGTLTEGQIQIRGFSPRNPSEAEKDIIFNLEKFSEHPIAKSLLACLGDRRLLNVAKYKEVPGMGVFGSVENDLYSLTPSLSEEKHIIFSKNDQPVLSIEIDDRIDRNAGDVVKFLKNHWNIFMVSGDKKKEALRVASQVGIPEGRVFFEKNPIQKKDIIKKFSKRALYFGDGINDSLAMGEALVAVSMKSSADVAFKASQVHILEGGIGAIRRLFAISKQSLFSMKIILVISIAYNVFFSMLAGFGAVKPLVAVLIMPVSSLSITLLGLWLMKWPINSDREVKL